MTGHVPVAGVSSSAGRLVIPPLLPIAHHATVTKSMTAVGKTRNRSWLLFWAALFVISATSALGLLAQRLEDQSQLCREMFASRQVTEVQIQLDGLERDHAEQTLELLVLRDAFEHRLLSPVNHDRQHRRIEAWFQMVEENKARSRTNIGEMRDALKSGRELRDICKANDSVYWIVLCILAVISLIAGAVGLIAGRRGLPSAS